MTIAAPLTKLIPFDDESKYPVRDGKPMAESDLHRGVMYNNIVTLELKFAGRADVYVSGNNFLYYQQGVKSAVVSPDCYVVFGVAKRRRDTYMVWRENGVLPSFVLEVTSKKTRREDMGSKRRLYEQTLRVAEYVLFDPTGDYLIPRLQGYRLGPNGYERIARNAEARLVSETLGLELFEEGELLRFYDPIARRVLPTWSEEQERANREAARASVEAERANAETERANAEAARAEAETQARRVEAERANVEAERANAEAERANAEAAENALLRAEIEALRKQAGA